MKKDAELIQNCRKKIGLSRWNLAFKAGVAELTIANIENQKSNPRKATLIKIYDALIDELKNRR